jgi:hypothetical protein
VRGACSSSQQPIPFKPMKPLFAALVLLLQLQPLLGTAVCLSSERAARPECEMPDHVAVPHRTVTPSEPPAPNCALASICAPSPLAIVSLPERVESLIAVQSEPPITAAHNLFGISSAPPFHPPRA